MDSVRWRFCLRNWSRQRLMTIRVIHVAKTRFALELAQPLPSFHPCFLGKINRFFLIPHHAVGAGVNLVAMPGHQLLESLHFPSLRLPHQRLLIGGGMIRFQSSV